MMAVNVKGVGIIPDNNLKVKDAANEMEVDANKENDMNILIESGIKGNKRPFSEIAVPRKRAKKEFTNLVIHTPLSILNQLMPSLVFTVDGVEGPSHSPTYKVSVQVGGERYEGVGIGKQNAKQRLAETVLQSKFPDYVRQAETVPMNSHTTPEQSVLSITPPSTSPSKAEKIKTKALAALGGQGSPLAVVNEILSGVKFECISSEDNNTYSRFVYSFQFDGQVYKGSGNSKKNAKTAAARAYLSYKYGEEVMSASNRPAANHKTTAANGSISSPRPASFSLLLPSHADMIANLVLEQYQLLMKGREDYARRKVIAGLVVTQDDWNKAQVISIATGTKAINGEYLSVTGSAINDSHAEIVTRRGFLLYLYSQLEALASGKPPGENCILELRPNKKGFHVKKGVKFHLYINTAPCGDARIFSPHESNTPGGSLDRHPNRQSRGLLRSKIESGEGTIPIKETIQTWDAVIQGERLLTMSCSDKLLKFNLLGLQGSMLSHFIEPVYIESLVFSSLFNQTHLYRAVAGRLEMCLSEKDLPEGYRFNKPLANRTSSTEPRAPSKAPSHSVNWVAGLGDVEIVNAVTGKTVWGGPSRLCKSHLLNSFMKLIDAGLPTVTGLTKTNCPSTYREIKQAASTHWALKEELFASFPRAKLGTWIRKPIEQDQFDCVPEV